MTARLPYFPFYPKDFASDGLVEAMTTAEVGCYVLLLCKAWHEDPTGTIPADDETLARWCRVSIETWATVKGRVLAPWKLGQDGRWHQGRMKAEADKAQESYARRKKASDVANERRWSPNRIPIASESDRNRTPIGRPSGSQSESESESDKKPIPDPVEVVADRKKTEEIKTAGDILDESLHRGIDRTGMIHTLASECGFTSGRAIQLAGDPWLTPERLRYIIDLAAKQCGKNGIQGYVVAGIKGHYEPDPTKGQTIAKPAYVPSREGAW